MKAIFKYVLVLTCIAMAAFAIDDAKIADILTEAENYFVQGNEASGADFEKAMLCWRKAAVRYEQAVREGELSNALVFYNLGNVYYRMNDFGYAILNYKRALKYAPADKKLQENLNAARMHCQDYVATSESSVLVRKIFFWHYKLPWHVRKMVFALAFALIWLLKVLGMKWRISGIPIGIAVCIVIAVVFGASLITSCISDAHDKQGVIVASETVGRKGNGESYENSFQKPLHAGTEFSLLDTRNNWLEIRLADGRTCWILEQDAEML